MQNCPSLETKSRALRLRGMLYRISDISYSFSKLNKEFPLDHQDQQAMEELIRSYHGLIRDVLPTLQSYEEEFLDEVEPEQTKRTRQRSEVSGVATHV